MHPIPTETATISERLAAVHAQINSAAVLAGRRPEQVCLIAASKTQPPEVIREAAAAGQRDFGENYVQEAVDKIRAVNDPHLVWHFIGAIQSNKTRILAATFDWVHTVDRIRIARRLDRQCPAGRRLNICLQVNVDEDPNKAGVVPDDTGTLLDACGDLDNLRVRGLMTILDPRSDPILSYARLHDLFAALADRASPDWDTLSMGMSGDFAAAIAAGATHIRIGTAIFGPRDASAQSPAAEDTRTQGQTEDPL
ncbi:MAG: YggS family pyridoxal phosphate-dependent enzyme [Pseudomonadales bacterium]